MQGSSARPRGRVLLLGGDRSAVVAARDLGRHGWDVAVAHHPAEAAYATRSRATRTAHELPDPQTDLAGYGRVLGAVVAREAIDVVLPTADDHLAALALVRDQVDASVPLAPTPRVLHLLDKLDVEGDLVAAGFGVPTSLAATDDVMTSWVGPAIVKDRSHWRLDRGRGGRSPTVRVEDPSTLRDHVRRLREGGSDPVLQAPVAGRMHCASAFRFPDGRVAGHVHQTSDHIWPVPLGTTSRATTTAVDPGLAQRVTSLLERLGWIGMVNLQLFRQPDGCDVVIDVNGRFNHSLALSVGAGVHYADAWATVGTDGTPAPLRDAEPGHRMSFLVMDTRRALRERRGGLVADMATTWWFALRAHHTMLLLRDPGPGLAYARHGLRRGTR